MRKNLSIAVCIFSLSLIALFNFSCISARKEKGAVGPTTNLGVKTSEVSEEKTTDTKPTSDSSKEEIKEIEEKAAETKEDLKEKGEAVKAAQKEAEKSIKEKESIEKKVQSKEQAAIIAREKLEALKKEAEVTKKPEVLKETKQLAKEAEKLEKEADVHREKLKTAESKAGFAQKKVDVQQATVDALKKELEDLKKARAAKRSFLEKTLASVTIIFIGLILLFLMKLGLKNFGRLITKKDVLREDALTLRIKTISKLFNWLGGFIIMGIVVYKFFYLCPNQNFPFSSNLQKTILSNWIIESFFSLLTNGSARPFFSVLSGINNSTLVRLFWTGSQWIIFLPSFLYSLYSREWNINLFPCFVKFKQSINLIISPCFIVS